MQKAAQFVTKKDKRHFNYKLSVWKKMVFLVTSDSLKEPNL